MTSATALQKTISAHDTEVLGQLESGLRRLVDDKDAIIETTLCALLANGHVLLEDVPGVGKTTYIKALARMIGLEMQRIQFTSDLLPSDVIGVEVFSPERREFVFHKGPIFAQILLADELNRASPRTQSALLEAMGEGLVTVDRRTYELPKPFIVFAAQNPLDSAGTYELPESQLDRFAARLKMGYPSGKREIEIFRAASRDPVSSLPTNILTPESLLGMQEHVSEVHISERVAAYAKRYVDASRASPALRTGVSTRGGVIWLRMARARAVLKRRDYVTPDDLQALAQCCLCHRVQAQPGASAEAAIAGLLNTVDAG